MRQVGLSSAIIYLGTSVLAAGLFLAITLFGDYTWVARIGGTIWIFLLSNIVLMPLVIPRIKKRIGAKE